MRVKPGEVWEFSNSEHAWERYALVYIVEVVTQNDDPHEDFFTCLCLDEDTCEHPRFFQSHLTMRTEESKHLWKRIA